MNFTFIFQAGNVKHKLHGKYFAVTLLGNEITFEDYISYLFFFFRFQFRQYIKI